MWQWLSVLAHSEHQDALEEPVCECVRGEYVFVCPTSMHVWCVYHEFNQLHTTAVFDKRDGFSFHIVNFPHMDSNIPSKPAYGVYISQLVRIGRICDSYESFFSLDTTN